MHSVLVVDDDHALRGALSSWVQELGYEVRAAESATGALDTLSAAPADVALCDVHMPGEDGVWLASQIRERYPSTAVIMATGAHDVDIAVASLRSNIVDYLLKPFGRARLIEALRLGVDWHRASKANEEIQESLENRLRSRRAEVAAKALSAE